MRFLCMYIAISIHTCKATAYGLLGSRGVTIHMKHETRHLAVHGLRDNTYHETTNEIPNIISHVMTWFHKHADTCKSFKLKCALAVSEMFKFLGRIQIPAN